MAQITPEQLAKAGTEHALQMALFCWAATQSRQTGWSDLGLLFAVPNGGARHAVTANKLKAEGVKAGVPDICWPVARGQWHGMFVEMKIPAMRNRKNGGATDEQLEWHDALRLQGYYTVICYDWTEARDQFIQYAAMTRGQFV